MVRIDSLLQSIVRSYRQQLLNFKDAGRTQEFLDGIKNSPDRSCAAQSTRAPGPHDAPHSNPEHCAYACRSGRRIVMLRRLVPLEQRGRIHRATGL
jgi:hypothetical protein